MPSLRGADYSRTEDVGRGGVSDTESCTEHTPYPWHVMGERDVRPCAGIELRAVSKAFNETLAIEALDLSVARGEFVSVIGPSGCGKSTLLRIIAGLICPDAGSVRLFNETPAAASQRKDIGFVPQSPALLAWLSVLENVELPLKVNRKAGRNPDARPPTAILDAFGLGHVLNRRPKELSGGMAQRVAIARAFSFSPSVLLMDEPFSALDELTREVLRRELLTHCEGAEKTVVFVTHSVTEAILMADRVLVMSDAPGKIVASIDVALERPRPDLIELTDAFLDLERKVRAELSDGRSRATA
jgi:NitT/TauT family transport system ATP-binding protein